MTGLSETDFFNLLSGWYILIVTYSKCWVRASSIINILSHARAQTAADFVLLCGIATTSGLLSAINLEVNLSTSEVSRGCRGPAPRACAVVGARPLLTTFCAKLSSIQSREYAVCFGWGVNLIALGIYDLLVGGLLAGHSGRGAPHRRDWFTVYQ